MLTWHGGRLHLRKQSILGHSQIAVTMNIYGHVMPATQQEAGQIDAALVDDESEEPDPDEPAPASD